MANRYEKPTQDVKAMLDDVLEQHHPELRAVGVTFDVLMAYAPVNDDGELTGPALKLYGYPTNSISSVVNLKNRVKGNADAEILLDGDTWPKLTSEQQEAILDRALEYFNIARNIDGEVINDTHGRPKLKLRQPDWHFSLFNSIAARHGSASPEVETMKKFAETCSEMYFSFVKELEAPAAGTKKLAKK